MLEINIYLLTYLYCHPGDRWFEMIRALRRKQLKQASNLVTHKNRFNETIVCDYDVAIFPHNMVGGFHASDG